MYYIKLAVSRLKELVLLLLLAVLWDVVNCGLKENKGKLKHEW